VCDPNAGQGYPQIQATNEFTWATVYACATNQALPPAPAKPATCVYGSSDNIFYDFSGLVGDIQLTSGDTTFYINLCEPLTTISGGSCTAGSTYICEVVSGSFPVSIGSSIPTTATSPATTNGLNLGFTGGVYCSGPLSFQTQVNMVCGAETSGPTYVGVSNCVYTFTWTTPAACPDVTPAPNPEVWEGWGAIAFHQCGSNAIDLFVRVVAYNLFIYLCVAKHAQSQDPGWSWNSLHHSGCCHRVYRCSRPMRVCTTGPRVPPVWY